MTLRGDPDLDSLGGGGGGGGGLIGLRSYHQSNLVLDSPPVEQTVTERRKSGGLLSRSDPSFDVVSERFTRQSWRMKLRQPFDIIQTQLVRDKAHNLEQHFARLEHLTAALAEEDETDPEEEAEFIDSVLKIKEEVRGIFSFMELLLRDRLTQKQMQALRDLRTQFNPAQDISVRYFGLDWREMAALVAGLYGHVSGLCDVVLGNQGPNLVMPSMLVRDLNKIREDVVSHAEAVLNGRLNRRRNDFMREQQNRHRDFLEQLQRRQSTLRRRTTVLLPDLGKWRLPGMKNILPWSLLSSRSNSERSLSSAAASKRLINRERSLSSEPSSSSSSAVKHRASVGHVPFVPGEREIVWSSWQACKKGQSKADGVELE